MDHTAFGLQFTMFVFVEVVLRVCSSSSSIAVRRPVKITSGELNSPLSRAHQVSWLLYAGRELRPSVTALKVEVLFIYETSRPSAYPENFTSLDYPSL